MSVATTERAWFHSSSVSKSWLELSPLRDAQTESPDFCRRTIEMVIDPRNGRFEERSTRSFRKLQKPSKKASNIFPGQRRKTAHCAQMA
jgi:hypothetical protein